MRQTLIVGISGASGAIYGIRALQRLRELNVETHLIMSRASQITITHETPFTVSEVAGMADVVHRADDIAASISSGSFQNAGMLVAPCSIRSLAEIATGVTSSLLTRAADVALKERRKLVLVVRETPLHVGHLETMVKVTNMGAVVAPPVPAFYTKPVTIDDIVDHAVVRALDLFGFHINNTKRWLGLRDARAGDRHDAA